MVETGRRTYHSPLREEQARTTRRAIVEAARDLFLEQGYSGTTIDAVAARAGVSRKTVFTAVGGKAALLKVAWDWALVGDDEPVPMVDRPAVRELQAATDPDVLLGIWPRFAGEVTARITGLHAVLTAAADVDPEAAAIDAKSEQDRYAGALAFVRGLAALGGLRPDLTEERAAQVAATLMDPLPYRRLVVDAGWTFDEYADWLERMARASFQA